MLVIVVVGFAPSYFLRGAVFAKLPSLLVHLHGAVFSSWIILFVIQSSLVTGGNIRLHRKLGILGAVLAGLMVILGVLAPFGTLRRGAELPPIFTPASFLIGNVLGILMIGTLIAVAIYKRNDRVVHKRLMLIANANLLSPALSRMNFPIIVHYPFLIGVIPLAFVLAIIVLDFATLKRTFVVSVIGVILTGGFDFVVDPITKTPLAERFIVWAQHHP